MPKPSLDLNIKTGCQDQCVSESQEKEKNCQTRFSKGIVDSGLMGSYWSAGQNMRIVLFRLFLTFEIRAV